MNKMETFGKQFAKFYLIEILRRHEQKGLNN